MKLFKKHPTFLRIAHISDLHFSKITFNPIQFLSKRWIGNLNLMLFRRKMCRKEHLYHLSEYLKKQELDLIIISGDLSSTSTSLEFKMAQKFLQTLNSEQTQILIVPGNHDQYTKHSFRKKLFYKFFENPTSNVFEQYKLKDNRIQVHRLNEQWMIITLDTTLPTSLLSAQGLFTEQLEKNLCTLLQKIPKNTSIIMVNHYPFFQNDSFKNLLLRGSHLQKILQTHPNIKLYLHGHTHRQCIADLRTSQLPLILDSGSAGDCTDASFHIMDLYDQKCDLKVYQWEKNWTLNKELSFNFQTTYQDQ